MVPTYLVRADMARNENTPYSSRILSAKLDEKIRRRLSIVSKRKVH